jgi:hypothetical protein
VGSTTQQVLVSAEVPAINIPAGSQSFSSSGSFTLPLGVTNFRIFAGAGGGGGGGGHKAPACGSRPRHHGGVGGKGGSFSYSYTSLPTQSNSIDFTVGQGGAGGAGGESGRSGGSTTVSINGTTVGTAAGGGGGGGFPDSGDASKVVNGVNAPGGGGGLGGAAGLGAQDNSDPRASPGNDGSVIISWDAVNIPGSPAVYRTETTPVYEPVTEPIYQDVIENIYAPVYGDVYAPVTEDVLAPVYEDILAPIYENILAPVYEDITEAVYEPIYATVPGAPGSAGGTGGYTSVSLAVRAGDQITVVVGASGRSARGGLSTYLTFDYSGGNAGASSAGGAGGGGGGASFVLHNGQVVAVAAGGGGGGGGGTSAEDRLPGLAGLPGTNSGSGSGIRAIGRPSSAGIATGGGGGGGFWAGAAGVSGKSGGGGAGGTNYGKSSESGNADTPGGLSSSNYPGQNVGYAERSGAALVSLYKSFSLAVKTSSQWKRSDRSWVKISGQWREIYNGWVKINGAWREISYGSETTVAPSYQLSANKASVNEGDSVDFRLSTTGVPAGTSIAYTATGIAANDLTSGSLLGSFIVGSRDTISFGIKANQTTNGARTLTVVLDGSVATESCVVNDTSMTPAYGVIPERFNVDEGSSLTFNVTGSDITDGTYYWTINNNAGDFGTSSGTFTITNNTGSFSVTPRADLLTEGAETFTVSVRAGGVTGAIVATSGTVTINDTSTLSYQIAAPASIDEGATGNFSVSTTGVVDGTTLYWSINHNTTTDADFNAVNGAFTINNNSGTFVISPVSDLQTEGSQSFAVSIRTGSVSGVVVATSTTVAVNDTSLTPVNPTYTLSRSVGTVNEGGVVVITLATGQISSGTSVPWTITGAGITLNDFDSIQINGSDVAKSLTGNFVIQNGISTLRLVISSDQISEGSETFTVSLDNGQASISVNINDTSTVPPPTYSINPTRLSVDEGSSISWNITTTNFGSGTLYYTTAGTIGASDFTDGINSGSISVSNNVGNLTKTLTNDAVTENSETIVIQLRTQSTNGPIVATANSVTVNDTSQTPPPPPPEATYQLSNSVASVNEGGVVMFTLVTQNVSDGTQVPYTISGAGVTSGDFDSMQVNGSSISTALTGNFIIQNGVSTLRVVVAKDSITEGTESFALGLNNGQGSVSVTINDTSTDWAHSYVIGSQYPFGGCAGAGWTDLTLYVSVRNGVVLSVSSVAADYKRNLPAANSGTLISGSNLTANATNQTGWWIAGANGRDKMAFQVSTTYNANTNQLTVIVYGNCKGGSTSATTVEIYRTSITPN